MERMWIVMNKKILKLTGKTLWCDIKHGFRGYNMILALVLLGLSFAPPEGSTFLCLAYFIELAVMRFMSSCDRITFVMPLSAADRKRYMIYRQFAMEVVFVLLIFGTAGLRYVIFGYEYSIARCVVNNLFVIAVMLFETCSAIYFCGWYKDISMREKGFGIFFSILAWVAFLTALMLSGETKINYSVMLIVCFGGILVQMLVKVYYMVHSTFDEYRIVNAYEGMGGVSRKKNNAADEAF